MRHAIPIDDLGPAGPGMAAAVGSCVHCGFCLPTCPTYTTLGEEMDSPRGRILLMKEVLEGHLKVELARPHIDRCLGCLACETACPSGVRYGELITPFRAYALEHAPTPLRDRARRALLLGTLSHPQRFRLAVRLGVLARPLARLLPRALRQLVSLLPAPVARVRPAVGAAVVGPVRARVSLLRGCAQEVLAPQITQSALRVLRRNGIDAVVPDGQACCGALAMHQGALAAARRTARRNLAAFADAEAVLTTAAGCGSGMREYGALFAGEAAQAQAQALAGRVVDVSAFLAEIGLVDRPPSVGPVTVAYHDACHLAHAQGVRAAPRELLRAIDGVTLAEPAEWQLCCGSAGTYNADHPDTADRLGERKARNLIATGAQVVVSGNIGCINQLERHLRLLGSDIPVLHTIEALDRAYAGRALDAREGA
jgi:glycolate oxidase iron-sulfur subunit